MESSISLDLLNKNLDELEKLASSCVSRCSERIRNLQTPESFLSRSDEFIESREGVIAEVPKRLPPGRRPPTLRGLTVVSSLNQLRKSEYSQMSPAAPHELSTVLWQATEKTLSESSMDHFGSSKSSLAKTPKEDFAKVRVDFAR